MESKNLADLYGLPLLDWDRVEARLEKGVSQAPRTGGPGRHTCWLATINRDGSPHVTGVGALWFEGTFWFETGEATRKGRNLARDPRCTLSLATKEFDIVVNGDAGQGDGSGTGGHHGWTDGMRRDWPARVDESGAALTAEYSAPSAGPPPWAIYRITRHVMPRRWRQWTPEAQHAGGSTRNDDDGSLPASPATLQRVLRHTELPSARTLRTSSGTTEVSRGEHTGMNSAARVGSRRKHEGSPGGEVRCREVGRVTL